jgi:hypothetical protein
MAKRAISTSVKEVLEMAKNNETSNFMGHYTGHNGKIHTISNSKLDQAIDISREFSLPCLSFLEEMKLKRKSSETGPRNKLVRGETKNATVNSNGAVTIGLTGYFWDGKKEKSAGKTVYAVPGKDNNGNPIVTLTKVKT